MLLLPYGKPTWANYKVDVIPKVDLRNDNPIGFGESPSYMKLEFDQFNQLCASSVLGKIFLAYLNIVCTSLLPSAHTGLTGVHSGISMLRSCWISEPYSPAEVALLEDCLAFQHSHLPRNPTKDLVIRFLLASHDGADSIDILFRDKNASISNAPLRITDEVMPEVRSNNRDSALLHPVDVLTDEERDVLIGSDSHRLSKNMMGSAISLSYDVLIPKKDVNINKSKFLPTFQVNHVYSNFWKQNYWKEKRVVFFLDYNNLLLKDGKELKLAQKTDFDDVDSAESFYENWPMMLDAILQSNEDFSEVISKMETIIAFSDDGKDKRALFIILEILQLADRGKHNKAFEQVKTFLNKKVRTGEVLKSCFLVQNPNSCHLRTFYEDKFPPKYYYSVNWYTVETKFVNTLKPHSLREHYREDVKNSITHYFEHLGTWDQLEPELTPFMDAYETYYFLTEIFSACDSFYTSSSSEDGELNQSKTFLPHFVPASTR